MRFYSSGKILLTSEYMVLRGAKALALATKQGQYLDVQASDSDGIEWVSKAIDGSNWFQARFSLDNLEVQDTANEQVSNRLQVWLQYIKDKRPDLFTSPLRFETMLDFDRSWGLGSSSTLVSNLSKWSDIDGIELLHAAMKGSGYDVAVGLENASLIYSIEDSGPRWDCIDWHPRFSASFFFVFLGTKALSEKHVIDFNSKAITPGQLADFDAYTNAVLNADSVQAFTETLNQHEDQLAQILGRPTIKEARFNDYPKMVKSLGAWGGDFVLVEGETTDYDYFTSKGYTTILGWSELIKSAS